MYKWIVFLEVWEPETYWDEETRVSITERVKSWKVLGQIQADHRVQAEALAELKHGGKGQLLVRSEASVSLDNHYQRGLQRW